MALNKEKFIEEIGGMSVLELSELVKALEEKFGVSAAAPMMGAAAPSAAAAPAAAAGGEKTEFKVELSDGGAEKIKVIKALRTVTTLGLTEAKKAVEEAPTVIADAASKADAQKMKEVLEAAGAKVTLS